MLNQSDGAFFHKKVSSVALWIVFAFVLEKKKKLIFVETSWEIEIGRVEWEFFFNPAYIDISNENFELDEEFGFFYQY